VHAFELQPHISKENTKPEAHWVCKRCLENMPGKGRENKVVKKESIRKMCNPQAEPPGLQVEKDKLPYDVSCEHGWDCGCHWSICLMEGSA
jgi:hypothetical protein